MELPLEIWFNIGKFLPLRDLPTFFSLNSIFSKISHSNYFWIEYAQTLPQYVKEIKYRKDMEGKDFARHLLRLQKNKKKLQAPRLKLDFLKIEARQMYDFPLEFGECDVRKIYCLYSPSREISEAFFRIKKLEVFSWCGSQLNRISPRMSNLSNLRCLRLYRNRLKYLPSVVYQLSQLEELDLGCNPLKTLHQDIILLAKLRILLLEKTQIKELPSNICFLSNLQHLNLEKCCFLQQLPTKFGKLSSLICLNISLANIQFLPRSFRKLKGITQIVIDESQKDLIPVKFYDLIDEN